MDRRERYRYAVIWNRIVKAIPERIERDGRSNILRRGGIVDWVRRVHNAIEARDRGIYNLRSIQDFAITECSIVAPASVKQLIALYTNRDQKRLVFNIDRAIAKFEKTRARASRDDLLERIKRVIGIWRHANFRSGRCVWRCDGNTIGVKFEGMIGRDVEGAGTFRFPVTSSARCEFVVLLHVGVIKVTVNPELIVTQLMFESGITTPAFLFRIRTRERVIVKAEEQTAGSPDTPSTIDPIACRRQAVRKVGRS